MLVNLFTCKYVCIYLYIYIYIFRCIYIYLYIHMIWHELFGSPWGFLVQQKSAARKGVTFASTAADGPRNAVSGLWCVGGDRPRCCLSANVVRCRYSQIWLEVAIVVGLELWLKEVLLKHTWDPIIFKTLLFLGTFT